MIPTQEEAFQSIVDRFPDHTVELGEEWIEQVTKMKRRPVIIDGVVQTNMNWAVMDKEEWEGSYGGIPTHAELTAMVYEAIYYHITGKWHWEEDE